MVDEKIIKDTDFENTWNNDFTLKKQKKVKKIISKDQPDFVIDISQVAKVFELVTKNLLTSVNAINFLELAIHTNFKGTKDFKIKTKQFLEQYEYENALGISNKVVDFIKNMGLRKSRKISIKGNKKEKLEEE